MASYVYCRPCVFTFFWPFYRNFKDPEMLPFLKTNYHLKPLGKYGAVAYNSHSGFHTFSALSFWNLVWRGVEQFGLQSTPFHSLCPINGFLFFNPESLWTALSQPCPPVSP